MDVEVCHVFSASAEIIVSVFSFRFVNVVYRIDRFACAEPSSRATVKPTGPRLSPFQRAIRFGVLEFG